MDDLDRLFHHLVHHLARAMPDRLRKPFQVSELYQRLVPYRDHKRELGFESIEDYEMAVLRLLAGERQYASVEPPDVQEALSAEAKQVNPDPGAFREFAAATVVLSQQAVGRVVHHDAAYAPPGARAASTPVAQVQMGVAPDSQPADTQGSAAPEKRPPTMIRDDSIHTMAAAETRELVFEPVTAPPGCPHCGQEVPAGRKAVFCPFCGEQLGAATCHECGASVELGWRYCLSCGARARGNRQTDAH